MDQIKQSQKLVGLLQISTAGPSNATFFCFSYNHQQMSQYKEEKAKKQQVTLASLRTKRDQIQQIFKTIRQANTQPLLRNVQQPQICQQIPQPIILPQLRPEYLQYIQEYLGRMGGPAWQNFLPVLAPAITYNAPKLPSSIEAPIEPDIYFQKENFRIYKKLIGEGTFSKVWQGVNLLNNQKIAAKQIKKLQDHESKCLKSLTSPFIVKIYTILRHRNSSFIILEYCERNLREELVSCNYQLEKVLTFFQQMLQGMHVLQTQNFIHRDLKFQNILISRGNVKIADFGLAKHIGDQMEVQSRRCGTPYTMAPQIYFSKDYTAQYTVKCDIWSFGVILHEMLYQKHPFGFSSSDFKRKKRVSIKKKFGILDNLIEKCLVFNPSKRIQWSQILKIYSAYRRTKDRFMEIEFFPIQAESIVYEQQKNPQPAALEPNAKQKQRRQKQQKRRLEQSHLKYMHDYDAQNISYNHKDKQKENVEKPLRKNKRQREELELFLRIQAQELPSRLNRNKNNEQLQYRPESISLKYSNIEHRQHPVSRKDTRNRQLFSNYRRQMEKQNYIAEEQLVRNTRKDEKDLTEVGTVKRQVVRVYSADKQEGINRGRIASQTITMVFLIILVILIFVGP